MSGILLAVIHNLAALTAVFTLSGGTRYNIDLVEPYNTRCTVKIGSDGKVYFGTSLDGAELVYIQQSTTTDWLIPRNYATAFYVQYTNFVGDALDSTPGSEDTAIAMTSDREWILKNTSIGSISCTFDIQILARNQTTVLATGEYTLTAENSAV